MPRPVNLDRFRTKEFYVEEYTNKQKSTSQIAAQEGTYTNMVRRDLAYYGIPIRDKGEAQKLALANGTSKHPTKGRTRTEEERINIGRGSQEHWDSISDVDRKKFADDCRERWDQRPEDVKHSMRTNSVAGIQKSAREGSKMEKYVVEELRKNGLSVDFHNTIILSDEKYEVDLLLPGYKIAIEIDGPSHSLPIFGEEALARAIENDTNKNTILTQFGFTVIRVNHTRRVVSDARKRQLIRDILGFIELGGFTNDVYFMEV